LPKECICVFWVDLRTAIITLYNIKWVVCKTDIYHFKAQWPLYVPLGLTLNNATFCPNSVLMCFGWIWEQRLLPCTILNRLFVKEIFTTLKPSGHYMYRFLYDEKCYVLPKQFIWVFWVDLRTAIISLYNINWLVCKRDIYHFKA